MNNTKKMQMGKALPASKEHLNSTDYGKIMINRITPDTRGSLQDKEQKSAAWSKENC